MRKIIIILVVIVVIVAVALGAWQLLSKDKDKVGTEAQSKNSSSQEAVEEEKNQKPEEGVMKEGRYVDYEPKQVGVEGYDTTVLFFHAPWCPDCQAMDQAINEGNLPAGTQILKVDYDSNKELRKQYGVTVQTTFIRVDTSGEKEESWIGNGDASLEEILENIK